MKWLWLALVDPLVAFDLIDGAGKPDHGKIAGWVAFWVFVVLTVVGKLPSLGITITMFAGAFGSRMFVAFLKARSATATEAETVVVNRTIVERRDPRLGAEATP